MFARVQHAGRRGRFIWLSATGLWLVCPQYQAIGQTAQPTVEASDASESEIEAKDIVVTATRVQRTGFNAPTPTSIVGAAAIEARGATNVATVLNEIPAFKASTTPATNSVRTLFPGSYYADLRGLTASRTLVLVDGNRFVPQITTALSGYQVDLNQIPSLMVERAEVVTGGASAQWGSDAVAGVVNLILKKDVTGLQFEAQQGISEVGDNSETRLSALAGTKIGDRAHLVVALDYMNNRGTGDVYSRGWGRQAYGLVVNPCPLAAAVSVNCPAGGNGLASTLILPDVRYSTSTNGGSSTAPPARRGSCAAYNSARAARSRTSSMATMLAPSSCKAAAATRA